VNNVITRANCYFAHHHAFPGQFVTAGRPF
jgi:hypothetical protein